MEIPRAMNANILTKILFLGGEYCLMEELEL